MAGGIVLLVSGVIAVGVAAPFLHDGTQTCTSNGSGFACDTPSPDRGFVAVAIAGALGVFGGIPLIVVGAQRVPPDEAARALPAWAGAPAGNGWRWTY